MHTGIYILLFLVGFAVLYFGAEGLVRGSSSIARSMGIRPMIIGLTVIAFGTSAPEFFVSFVAALQGVTDIAVGNVVGSNISNIGLVLGISAILVPYTLSAKTLKPVSSDLAISIGASVLFLIMAFDRTIGRIDGIILLVGIVAFTTYCIVRANKKDDSETQEKEHTAADPTPSYFIPLTAVSGGVLALLLAMYRDVPMSGIEKIILFPGLALFLAYCWWEIGKNKKAGTAGRFAVPTVASAAFTLSGLVMLIIGARLMTESAVVIAHRMGVSELAIGLTVVALGTSLPEMAASIVSVTHGEAEMCVGNIMGSNIFNIFLVIGGSAAVAPLPIDPVTLHYQMPIMIAFGLALVPSIFVLQKAGRAVGVFLTAGYVAFIVFAFMAS